MRKNKMMRVASALLVAVLLTTCAISSTFAKYVTADEFTDTARVAKWGVELQLVGNLYGDSYGLADKLVTATDGSISVQALADPTNGARTDIVAPGTKNDEGMKLSLTGQPEVDGVIDVSITTSNIYLTKGIYGVMVSANNLINEGNYQEYYTLYNTGTNAPELFYWDGSIYKPAPEDWAERDYYTLEDKYELTDAYYYPVVYTLDGTETKYPADNAQNPTDFTTDTLAKIAHAIAQCFDNSVGESVASSGLTTYTLNNIPFQSNTNFDSTYKLDDVRLKWSWAYENGLVVSQANGYYDGADTILGLINQGVTVVKANAGNYGEVVPVEDYFLNTTFSIDITVTQTDGEATVTTASS